MSLNILIVVMCVFAAGGAFLAWRSDNGNKNESQENKDSSKK